MDPTFARDCPICGSSAKTLLYRQAFADVGKVSFLRGYDVTVCDGCGFAFADNIPSQAAFDDYYACRSKYETPSSAATQSRTELLNNGLEFLSRGITDKNARILEIGCGSGAFLRFLQENGFTRLSAIDPSQPCVDFLREAGIAARCGTLSRLQCDETFDVIVLLTVLEHIVDLNSTLENVSRILVPGGLLFLRVPDACRFADYDDSPFQQFSPEHVNYFSIASATNLLGEHGYRLAASEEAALSESDNTVLPMINLLFAKTAGAGRYTIGKDPSSWPQLERYIRSSRDRESAVDARIRRLADSQEPIVVWGTGMHTLRLLELGALRDCKIVAFIDSNAHYEGGEFNNVRIESPKELLKYPHKVLISSRVFQNEIAHYIRHELKADNELVLLY